MVPTWNLLAYFCMLVIGNTGIFKQELSFDAEEIGFFYSVVGMLH